MKKERPRGREELCSTTVCDLQVSVSPLVKPRLDGADPQDLNGQGCAHEYA